MIGDIEVVAVPKIEREPGGLFGDQADVIDCLDYRLALMLGQGKVEKRLDKHGRPRWGPTLKFLTFQGAKVDLFTPCDERFGWILLLRTGPAAFSRQLVVPVGSRTKDGRPGLLPRLIAPRDGWLTWKTSGERIPTPEERDAFAALKLPYREPWERT